MNEKRIMKRVLVVGLILLCFFLNQGNCQTIEEYIYKGEENYLKGDYKRALEEWEKGLKLAEDLNKAKEISIFLLNIGFTYYVLEDYEKALKYYREALKICKLKELGKKEEGYILNNIGLIYADSGEYEKALQYYLKALNIFEEILDYKGQGYILNNIGTIQWYLGNYKKALKYYEDALIIRSEIDDKKGEGDTFNNIGLIYQEIGDYQKALQYLQKAIKILEEIKDIKGQGEILNNIGVIYQDMGENQKALKYYNQAIEVFHKINLPTESIELNIGDIYLEEEKLKEAYEIFKKIGDPIRLGKYYLKTKEYNKAEEEFMKQLNIEKKKGLPNISLLLSSYIGLGLTYEEKKEYKKAKENYEEAIRIIEKQRENILGIEREKYFEGKVFGFKRIEPYEGMIRVLVKEKEKGYESKSLEYAERIKSRLLVEMLMTKGVWKGKSKEDTEIIEKKRQYTNKIKNIRERIEKGKYISEEERKNLLDELKKQEDEYERFIEDVILKNTEIGSLITVSGVSAEKIQELIEDETAIIEYYTGDETLYIWLITKKWIKLFTKDIKKKELEAEVNKVFVPNIRLSRRPITKLILTISEEFTKQMREEEIKKDKEEFIRYTEEFYKILIGEIEKDIKTEEIIIVPHGVLHKVPFHVLRNEGKYLIEKYRIAYLPSSSIYEDIKKKKKGNKEKSLIIANPEAERGISLEGAEREGEKISKLFEKVELYKREKATETISKNKAGEYNVIHFACHGEFNERQPLQSGLLLAKDKENDGFLQVYEIFEMDLKNAELVTLSACETGLSSIRGGDDLVGLSRGFIYAGTPSLIATLWEVEDISTGLLMEEFYTNWKKKGMSKSEALRQAQLKIKNIPNYQHPYYWAPFILIGDSK